MVAAESNSYTVWHKATATCFTTTTTLSTREALPADSIAVTITIVVTSTEDGSILPHTTSPADSNFSDNAARLLLMLRLVHTLF